MYTAQSVQTHNKYNIDYQAYHNSHTYRIFKFNCVYLIAKWLFLPDRVIQLNLVYIIITIVHCTVYNAMYTVR